MPIVFVVNFIDVLQDSTDTLPNRLQSFLPNILLATAHKQVPLLPLATFDLHKLIEVQYSPFTAGPPFSSFVK